MTRSLPDPSLATFDPEIEKTLLHIRQAWRQLAFGGGEKVFANSPTISEVDSESSFEGGIVYSSIDTTNNSSLDLGTDTMAAPRQITLKEAGALDFVLQPNHIRHPDLNANFELKTALINLLPKYQGLPAQDPIRHLRDLQGVCSTTRREGSSEVAVWLYAFPFSLEGRAKEWFYSLPSEIVGDWDLLRREFLDKFFPAAVTDKLRKEISCIVQCELETLYEYWEQFRKLLDSCPNHMIDTLVLISCFCQGMKPQDKILLDASSNGSLTKYRTAEKAWQLISDLAESTFHAKQRSNHPRTINEVSSSVSKKITPWRLPIISMTALIKDTIHKAAISTKGIPNKEAITIKGVTTIIKVGEIIPTKVGGTIINNEVGTIEETKDGTPTIHKIDTHKTLHINIQTKEETTKPTNRLIIEEIEEEDEAHEVVEDEVPQPRSEVSRDEQVLEEVAQPIPFSKLARKTKKRVELDPKMVEMFKKVEVIIPLFDSIHQVPKYAKFLKNLCINKDKIHELETILLGSSISTLMGAIPEKCGDPGPCLVSCTIDGVQFIDCMCDLGACISIMPLSVYHILKLPPLKGSAARFVLVDKSIITVMGIAEDVLVNTKGLLFSIDFHILEMPSSESERTSSILLRRPFLRTSRFKLDVYLGTYSFEIDGRIVSFSLDEAMRHPPENHSIFWCDVIDNLVAEVHCANIDEKIEESSVGSPHECEEPPWEVQMPSQE
ncbi:uncharacterized protein [Arachis hypogaea]|uniref:uncharacterized protein n=1 Tax=Arachis hypogaea TaxID=3818 RepID=UPI003B211FA7